MQKDNLKNETPTDANNVLAAGLPFTVEVEWTEQWIVDDIFDQIYKRFEEDPIFEKKCRNVKYVLTNYHFTHKSGCIYETTRQIPYLDGVLYNPYDHKSYSRQIKLNKLLNNNCNI
ncbi:MAG TPA: hypothetical protein PKG93_00935 [Bacilli bacterium]|nr:hypothetical protein [Bacilli bacterium]